MIGRRVHAGPDLIAIQELPRQSECGSIGDRLAEFVDLICRHRHIQLTRSDQVAVDPLMFNRGDDTVEVVLSLPREFGHVVGPASESVAETVSQ